MINQSISFAKSPSIQNLNVSDATSINSDSSIDTVAYTQNSSNTELNPNSLQLTNRKVINFVDNPLIRHKNTEEKFINHFLNNKGLNTLGYEDLLDLYKIYNFSKNDLAEINNDAFIKHLYENKDIQFADIPKHLQKDIAIKEFNSGSYFHLEYIPHEYQTKEMFDTFFTDFYKYFTSCMVTGSYRYIFKFFSLDCQSRETWNKLLQHQSYYNRDLANCFEIIPKEFKTKAMCETYINETDYLNLNLIPKEFIRQLESQIIARLKTKTHAQGLELLPIELLKQYPEIIYNFCLYNNFEIDNLPSSIVPSKVLDEITKKYSLDHIPDKYINIDRILLRIKNFYGLSINELNIIDQHFSLYKKEIQEVALNSLANNNMRQLYKFIPDYLSEQKCLMLLEETKGEGYQDLPNKYRSNINILATMLTNYFDKIDTINFDDFTQEQYQQIFTMFPQNPAWELNYDKHKLFIQQKEKLLSSIPKEKRSLPIWIYLCNYHKKHVYEIPEQLVTKNCLISLVDDHSKKNFRINITFIEYLFKQKFFDPSIREKILHHALQCSARSSDVFLRIIKSPNIPHDFKLDLKKEIDAGNIGFAKPDVKNLYAKTNPLRRAIDAPYATNLLATIYKSTSSANEKQIALPEATQLLINLLAEPITELPKDTTENIFKDTNLVGGRTMQVNISDNQTLFYKFRKPQEELKDFANEGRIYGYLHDHPVGNKLLQLFASNIPKVKKMVRMPLANLPTYALTCPDGIDVFIDKDGIKYVDVLVLSIHKDYYHYAHTVDTEIPRDLYYRAEEGILKASHDIGVMMAHSMFLVNIIPAFHYNDYESREHRPWCALHMLMRKIHVNHDKDTGEFSVPVRNELHMTGKLEDWITATALPDTAFTGIRDLGDIEFAWRMNSVLNRSAGTKKAKLFFASRQKISVANTVVENLIGQSLIYARLHRNDPDYHYRNELCINKTKVFIGEIFSKILTGIFEASGKPNINLQQFLKLSDDDYRNTFLRIAQEIVYWTGKDHHNRDHDIIDDDTIDHYSSHVKQKKLPEDLFEHYKMLDNKNFNVAYNNNDLGIINGTFVLLALTNLSILFATQLIEDEFV